MPRELFEQVEVNPETHTVDPESGVRIERGTVRPPLAPASDPS